ncbi:MAG: DUF4190 domain-containing protein [Terriglobales bacterium]
MFCPKCANAIQEGSQFCNKCGNPVLGTDQSLNGAIIPTTEQQTSGKAVGSLVTGIFGLVMFPASIAAVVLGHMSRSEIRKSAGRLKGSGMALAGLILGYSGLALIPIAIILIIAAIAIPNLLRAKIAANEASAVSVIRTVNVAELTYRQSFPSVGYTCALSSLGGGEQSPASAEHAHMIDSVIASGHKNGYRVEIQNRAASDGVTEKYQVVAYPEAYSQTGVRAFCSDESAVIRFDPKGSADDCLAFGAALR